MVELFGVKLIGVSWENARKLLLTLAVVGLMFGARHAALRLLRYATRRRPNERLIFWARQVSGIVTLLAVGLSVMSIWFDNPERLAVPVGMVTAGLAFALQRVVTAVAGYAVIIRGKTFGIGDRIVMGGVRGDVIALGFVQTTILEMGEPPVAQKTAPAQWVQGRQYTGRVVTITNDKLFEGPVFNYTREFPFIWEELHVPIPYRCDRLLAEDILLGAAVAETSDVKHVSRAEKERLAREYFVELDQEEPRVYWRITDNWLELAVRFVCRPHEARAVKDRMSRRILRAFDEAHITIASSTFDVVGLPRVHVEPELAAFRGPPTRRSHGPRDRQSSVLARRRLRGLRSHRS